MSDNKAEITRIGRLLTEPFASNEIKFKPQTVKGTRAMVCWYIDARAVMDRLDEVVGAAGWEDHFDVLANGSVQCTLRVLMDDSWVSRSDVGSESEQPDGGDRLKAAFSDALKRAAVKFGIGRYLYRMPHQWLEFDPVKKQFVQPPKLPAWADPNSPQNQPKPEPKKAEAKPAQKSESTPTPTTEAGKSLFSGMQYLVNQKVFPTILHVVEQIQSYASEEGIDLGNLWMEWSEEQMIKARKCTEMMWQNHKNGIV